MPYSCVTQWGLPPITFDAPDNEQANTQNMKVILQSLLVAAAILVFPNLNHAQAPALGTAADFVLFSTNGAVTNAGTLLYLTKLTGNVGADIGAVSGFGNVDGQMHSGDATTLQAASDLLLAYGQLNAAIPDYFPGVLLGNGVTLPPGVYSIPAPATLSLELILDGQGDPDALFIFQIDGSFSTGSNSKVTLINGALACNVFWKVEGLVGMASGTTMRGTIVANNAAINMSAGDTLEGRALSINGAIGVTETLAYMPLGCGVPELTGPMAPPLGTTECFGLLSSIGPVTNDGITYVDGDVGTNDGLTTGFNPLFVNGTIHPIPDGTTSQAASDLLVVYNLINAMPEDIILMRPDLFGHNLVLTPHTYLMNGAVTFTDTLYLNAQGDPDAVFVIRTEGAFSTSTFSKVNLINGAQAYNVFWLVNGAVDINDYSVFNGTIIANGAINLQTGVVLNGRVLTVVGSLNTYAMTVNTPGGSGGSAGMVMGPDTVCQGETGVIFSVAEVAGATDYIWVLPTGVNITDGDNTDSITVDFGPNAMTGIWSVTVEGGSCSGPLYTEFEVVVIPTPTMDGVADQTICNGQQTSDVVFSGGPIGTTYAWTNDNTSIGLAANGNGDINAFTGINNGTEADTAMITVTPSSLGCSGADSTFLIIVNPGAAMNSVADQTVCNGQQTSDVMFSGGALGTTYSWTNDNTSIGLAANGNGDINAFTGINNGTEADTAMITVTPSSLGCSGADSTFLIIVNPTPAIAPVPDQTVCNGAMTFDVVFIGTVDSPDFNWTNDNTSIGLAANGNGNINAFTGINTTASAQTATITVTPSANGCSGASTTFTITVNPGAGMNSVADQTVCNGQQTSDVVFSGGPIGTTYSWTNDNTSIGLAGNGNGDINAFTGINNGTEADTAIVTVTPSSIGCGGANSTFLIIVNPTPIVNGVADQTICNGQQTSNVVFTGAVLGTTYAWTNDNTSIGLANNGNGNINAFTGINTTATAQTATITVTPSANGCSGASTTFTITVNPGAAMNSVADQTVCNGQQTSDVIFSGGPIGTTYSWTNDNTSIGLAANGNGNINAFMGINTTAAAQTATISVTPSATGCSGASTTFTITVNPGAGMNSVADQTVCNGQQTSDVMFIGGPIGTTYSWTNDNTSIGLAANGNGDINAFTGINTTATAQTATITVTPSANGCDGAMESFTITVNPGSTVNGVADQSLCNGASTSAVTFTGGSVGTTYNWTNSNPSIGLPASGNDNIASFTAINTGTSAQTATIIVTPTGSGCSGATTSFTITVNPTPTVNAVADQTLCNGEATDAVSFSGAVSGTSYSWTNSNPSIGLAASGSGNIASFNAINTTATAQTATITVTPSANGCSGASTTFTITVNPGSTVNGVANQSLCNGASTSAVTFTGSGVGTTFNWTNSNPSIGLPASGSGNIASFTAINTGSSTQTATIIVTPTGSGCSGATTSFTITVNPTPTVNAVADQTLCGNTATTNVVMGGDVAGTTYSWTNDNPSIGLAASGSGNIAPFTAVNTGTTPQTATITVTPAANGCSGSATTFTITVNAVPTANATTNAPVCEGASFTLNAETFVGGTYTWTGPDGFSSEDQDNTIANATLANAGTYTLVVVANGCASAPSTVDVAVNVCTSAADLSVVKTVDNTIPTVGQQVVFTIVVTNNGPTDATGVVVEDLLQSGYTYVSSSTSVGAYNTVTGIWNIGVLGNGDSETMTITATVNTTGSYTNTATVSGNEEDSNLDNNTSTVETFPIDFFIPEGFSPNADGVNDVFFIRGIDRFPANSILIFNRWGNRIFEASPYINTWDGKSTAGLSLGADDLPVGTYFYLLDLGNGSDVLKGTIYLTR